MDSSQDRKLPASQRKLDKARQEGQAARSRDLGNLAVLGTGSVALLLLAPTAFEHMRLALAQALRFDAATIAHPGDMLARLGTLSAFGLMVCAAFAAIVLLAVVAATVGAGGWVASLKTITPNPGRLNPLAGLGNLVSKQQLVNVGKLVLMSALVGFVGYHFALGSLETIARLAMQRSPAGLAAMADWLVSGMTLVLGVVAVAALIDVPLQNHFHKARLRMSHQEVKQEHKEADGNPHMKGHMRRSARELSQRASITAVPKAGFILMNPTHFAVAMRYDEATMSAPQVISKGADLLALKIRDIANSHSIPVVQSPMLARALYAHAELDQPIPASLFTAVAQVLAYVYRLKSALRGEAPMPLTVPEPFVPPELDPLNTATGKADA